MSAALEQDLSGKVAVVTGATTGIGKEIARGLARMGATVVVGARDPLRGEAARAELSASTGSARIEVMTVDMARPASVRAFASALTARHRRLQLVVNNAGVWFSERHETPDGLEATWATNVLGPYLLNNLLVDALEASAPARILNVVSALAADYDPSDVDFRRRKYDGFKVYAQSKQALRMLTWGLAARLQGTGVTVNAVAPGFVRSDFNRNSKGVVAALINTMARLFGSTPQQGADTPLWAAVAPELEGVTARYFDKRQERDGKFRDPAAIAQLERICEEMVSGGRTAEPVALRAAAGAGELRA